MSERQTPSQPDLTETERKVLLEALRAPVFDNDPAVMGACLRLCGRRLLQRAGGASAANGWRGSLHAFVLTRDGWNLLKAERGGMPIRRAG
ncbi:hypothetical protein [Phenylobacterium sp.]|uniref:hypothetical protein n=1 Tax=Phenylobacterium sp. TaxID=1871053 RepID=UPI0012215610|nr:hypothetical protein [Phenylobacterium sp.]THD62998.1 MAG: hypothetical protein E8A49_06505 [Phenylobacterium sp.]